MFAEFNTLPDSSKIWIYQSDRPLSKEEELAIAVETRSFLESWTAHQLNLKAGFSTPFSSFLIIAVDENVNGASGCSIDKKVHFIQSLEKKFKINFFNRLLVTYLKDGNIHFATFKELEKLLQSGEITTETTVFNNLLNTLGEFRIQWEVPLKKSWHLQLLNA